MIDNNFLPSPEDIRDYIFENLFKEDIYVPLEYDPRKNILPIRNQSIQGSCVAQACAAIKEIQESRQIGFNDYMSPQFVYNLRINSEGQGMYPRNAMQILRNVGIVADEDYPYNKIEKPEQMDGDLINKASSYKIKNYARVTTVEGVKKAIMLNGAVMIGVPVYSLSDPIWKPVHVGDSAMSGHAMCLIGYDNGGFIIRNSWGSEWGNDKNGYCTMPYSDWKYVGELWTIYDESSKPDPRYSKWYWKAWRGIVNIAKNMGAKFYMTLVSGIAGTVGGFWQREAWILGGVVWLFLIIYSIINKSYLIKDKN